MALPFLLMGAQAAGIFGSMFGNRKANKFSNRGVELENAQVDLRMKQERLAFEEEGLAALENLREVMSSQRALFAAQKRVPGIGSTAAIENRAMSNYSKDARSRSLSLDFREQYLKAQQTMKRIGLHGLNSEQSTEQFSNSFDMINFNKLSEFNPKSGFSKGFLSPLKGLIFGG